METAHIKFNGGIWSESLQGRYDLDSYSSAARTCENFIPTRYGQVEKRSGTKYIGEAKYGDKICVLHPFQFSVNTTFIFEFGDQYIRFWSNDLQVESAPSTPLEVATPYLEAELYELQIRAVNDVVYIVHPNHPVGKLTRIADDNWTYTAADLSLPFVDPDVNAANVTLTPSATTGNITITSSSDAFDADHVGSELRLEYLTEGTTYNFSDFNAYNNSALFDPLSTYDTTFANRPVYTVSGSLRLFYRCIQNYDPTTAWAAGSYSVDDLVTHAGTAYICTVARTPSDTSDPATDTSSWDAISTPVDIPQYFEVGYRAVSEKDVSGEWSLKTTGIWKGTIAVQRSIDGGANWATIKSLVSADDSNYLLEEDEEGEQVKIRINWVSTKDSAPNQTANTLTFLSTQSYGRATVTSVTDSQNVAATVIDDMPDTSASVFWQESAFSNRQGYPRAIALFDSRMVLAGTDRKPQGFFYSGIGLYDNFTATTTLADAPFFVEALSEDQSSIQWVSAQKELFVGTASVEGTLIARKNDEAQSAENPPTVKWNESMGSAHRPALSLNDSLACLQRGQTSINILSYSLDRDGYTGEEVTLLCPHLFDGRIQQLAHAREPYSGMYAVIGDGTLCHMVYEPRLQVTGWCKYTTKDGAFESVAILPEDGGNEDRVWCSVKRTVNGSTVRYIERFTTGNRKLQRDKDLANCWHLDSGKKYTGSPVSNTLTGLDHLEGEEVIVLIDGQTETHTVASGSVTTTLSGDVVIVGLIVCSYFEPLDVEMQGTPSRRRQHFHSKLLINNSFGGEVGNEGEDYTPIIYHKAGDPMNEITLGDGYYEIFHESSHARQKYWSIKHEDPFPFTLQAVMQAVKVNKK